MRDLMMLTNARYLVDAQGRRTAVQLSIEDWEALLDYVEGLEDRAVVRGALARLRRGPQEAGALRWDELRARW